MAVNAILPIAAFAVQAQGGDHLEQYLAAVGTSSVHDVSIDPIESGGEGFDQTVPAYGSAGLAACAIPQTGSAFDDTGPLLEGASGFDLSVGLIDIDTMGRDAAFLQHCFGAVGSDRLHSPLRPTSPTRTRDLRVDLILYRIENFSAQVPGSISFRMGCAS